MSDQGKLLLLDGAPSSGKSTLATSFQRSCEQSWIYLRIDDFMKCLAPQYRQLRLDETAENPGVLVLQSFDKKNNPLIQVRFGEIGLEHLESYMIAVTTLVKSGRNVIADMILTEEAWMERLQELCQGIKFYFVGLYAPLDVLLRREREREESPGMARGRYEEVYADWKKHDLLLDTSKTNIEGCIHQIKDLLEANG